MDYSADRECTLVVGASGTGKTTFVLRYLVNRQFVCRFVFDYDTQVSRRLGIPGARTPEECEAALRSRWVLFDPNLVWPGRHAEAFAWFCSWSFEAAGRGAGRKVLVVDEVWRYCNNWTLPEPLATCIQTGRVRELDLVFATQRPNKLNEAITGETTELVCFRLQGSNAKKVIADLGGDPDEVAGLPKGSFVSHHCGTGAEVRGRVW